MFQSGSNPALTQSRLKRSLTPDRVTAFSKGADAELLGIDVDSGSPQLMRTVAGDFLTYAHEVTLVVLGVETTTTAYFAADENFSRNVLGRQGWLIVCGWDS